MTNIRSTAEKLDRDSFLVKQKHLSWGKSKYHVYDDDGAALFYVERPVKPFRRADITIYHDDSAAAPVLILRQDHGYAAIKREYTLIDASTGEPIARLSRHNIKSWFRRAWNISHPDGQAIAAAREDTAWLAAVRRIVEWIPYAGILMGFVRTNFQIYAIDAAGSEVRVGAFNRKLSFGDKYKLDLSEDQERSLDRRTALALGIMLDTGEAR